MDSSGKALIGNWGNCLDGCPTDNSTEPTSPWDFAGLCETGQCPAGWNSEEESCVINLVGLEETAARERCGRFRGDFSPATQGSYHCKGLLNFMIIKILQYFNLYYLPVWKKYQCQCGVPNRSNSIISPRIIGGQNADKNEYPWQGKLYTLYSKYFYFIINCYDQNLYTLTI